MSDRITSMVILPVPSFRDTQQFLQRCFSIDDEAGAVLKQTLRAGAKGILADRVEGGGGAGPVTHGVLDHQQLLDARAPAVARTPPFFSGAYFFLVLLL